MFDKKTSVFGILNDRIDLDRSIDSLKVSGFSGSDISVLMPDSQSSKDIATEKNTKAPEGAATGVGTGVILGGALGWLIGAGMLAIPGVGPFIAAGPIMASLAGAGIGGTVGGVSGALIGMGLPEFEAKRYADVVHGGRILVSVHCTSSDEVSRAKEVLKRTGAFDISSTGESKAPERKTDDKNFTAGARSSAGFDPSTHI